MKSKFHYTTHATGDWQSDSPKETMRRILREMSVMLLRSELDGNLKEDLCTAPGPAPHPRWVENAERCRDKSFRDEGIAAVIELVEFVKQAPEDLEPFVQMAAHGTITQDVAAEFEPTMWALVNNYAFLRERRAREQGRDPLYFLNHAAEMLQLEIEGAESASNTCDCCGDPIDPVH